MVESYKVTERVEAARALGKFKAFSAVFPLLNSLKDNEETEVREAAIWSLGELCDISAVPRLIELVDHPEKQLQLVAIEALGKIGDVRAVDTVLKCIHAETCKIRNAAIVALGRIGEHSSAHELLELLYSDEFDCEEEWDDEDDYFDEALVVISIGNALENLVDASHIDQIVKLLESQNPRIQLQAVKLLGSLKLETVIKHLLSAGQDKDKEFRENVINSLAQIDHLSEIKGKFSDLNSENLSTRTNAVN